MKNEKIMPMNSNQFSEYLLFIQYYNAAPIEFALDNDELPNTMPAVDNCNEWYFAKIISLPKYQSNSVLFDSCGGDAAYAISLPMSYRHDLLNYNSACNARNAIYEVNAKIFKESINNYFKSIDTDIVFVQYNGNIISEQNLVKVITNN